MKIIKIKKLTFTNFRGQSRTLNLSDRNNISGRNEAGKTTCIAAHNWLWSSYTDADNSQNTDLYDKKYDIDIDTPVAEVEEVFTIDGIEYSLKRTAKAAFEEDRINGGFVKSKSDKYILYKDDVEISATLYKQWIEDTICPFDMIKYLLDGQFFINLSFDKKDEAIKILQKIVGEIKQSDFKGDYEYLYKAMAKYSIDELKSQTKTRLKTCIDRIGDGGAKIGSLQPEIDALNENMSNYMQIDFDALKSTSKTLIEGIKNIDDSIANSSEVIKPIIEKRNEELRIINEKELLLQQERNLYNSKSRKLISDIEDRISHIDRENSEVERRNKSKDREKEIILSSISNAEKEIEILETKREHLLNKFSEEKEKVFKAEKCSYCGQDLPLEMLDELQSKFNSTKRDNLAEINKEGTFVSEKKKKLESSIEDYKKSLSEIGEYENVKSKYELISELSECKKRIKAYEDTDEYKKLNDDICSLKSKLTEIEQPDNSDLIAKKNELSNNLSDVNKQLGLELALENIKRQISQLQQERKSVAEELTKLRKLDGQIKDYEKERNEITSCRVNDLLEFAMIETQVQLKDGTFKPSCTIRHRNGVRYETLNGGSRILTIVDIQRMFCKYYGVSLPLFIDECQSLDDSKIPSCSDIQVTCIYRQDCDFKIENIE